MVVSVVDRSRFIVADIAKPWKWWKNHRGNGFLLLRLTTEVSISAMFGYVIEVESRAVDSDDR